MRRVSTAGRVIVSAAARPVRRAGALESSDRQPDRAVESNPLTISRRKTTEHGLVVEHAAGRSATAAAAGGERGDGSRRSRHHYADRPLRVLLLVGDRDVL